MPYDRKTELLWNYLSMAQLTDLSKFWSQGPASTNAKDLSDWSKPPTITIRTDDPGQTTANNIPAYHAGAEPGPSSSDSPLSSFPVAEEAGDMHNRIVATPYVPPPAAANHSTSLPEYGGAGHAHGEASSAIRVVSITTVTTTTTIQHSADTSSSAPLSTPPDTTPLEDTEPKIYGPSAVATAASIESSPNAQSNDVVNTLDSSTPNGWSNVGSDHVGDLIGQMQQAGAGNGYGFVFDYVHGDVTSLTTVQQLNTIFNNDINKLQGNFTAPANSTLGDNSLTQSATSGGNSSGNTTVLQGNAGLAGYDALVVTGDLTKINKIVQINLIDDTDSNTVNAHADISTPYGTASSVWDAAIHSGGNVEINVGFIIDNSTGAVYLVGGTYGTFASATQVNILTNDDLNTILNLFHSQEGTGFLGFSTDDVIQSGGDSQSNQAGFLGSDSDSNGSSSSDGSHAGTPIPSDLTTLLAFANLHPTQEDGNIHVLFVDGNYTIVNLVVQINVIHDADQNTLDADASGATGSLTAPPPAADTTASSQSDSATADGQTESADPTTGVTANDNEPQQQASDSSTASTGTDHVATAATGAATTGTEISATSSGSDAMAPATSGDGPDSALPTYNDHSSLNYDQIVSSGSNDAGNHATIIDGSDGGPQLTIVQGHYYEYNEIYQVNVLVDSDHNTITSAMNTPVPASDHSDGAQDSTHLVTADDVLKSMTG